MADTSCETEDRSFYPQRTEGIVYQSGVIPLFGDITSEVISPIADYIIRANVTPELYVNFITLIICSDGGELPPTIALCDIIEGSSVPVSTIGLGSVSSGGLMLLMVGHKGYRIITPNTLIMSHQFSSSFYGKHHELMSQTKEHNLLSENMINFYKKHSSIKSKKTIEKILLPATDVYLTPEEALKYGLCDRIEKFSKKNYSSFGIE